MLHTLKYNKQLLNGSNKTAQFLHENISWKRSLDFFTQENNYLKTRLSEVVDRETDKIFIGHAELFQNEFIQKDEGIRDIGNDIKEQEINLQLAIKLKKDPDIKACKQQEKLRNEMAYLEKECSNLKTKFNKYILSIV